MNPKAIAAGAAAAVIMTAAVAATVAAVAAGSHERTIISVFRCVLAYLYEGLSVSS